MQVGHHLLMLTLYVILNVINPLLHAINPLLKILKLSSEPSLILVHCILHKVKLCVIDHCKFLHTSTKGVNLSR